MTAAARPVRPVSTATQAIEHHPAGVRLLIAAKRIGRRWQAEIPDKPRRG
jgi:hypothetical protein